MSLCFSEVKPFYRTVLKARGLKEHTDAFNIENIPETIFDKSFHILFGPFLGTKLNMHVQEASVNVQVRVFLKGFRDPANAVDQATLLGENIIRDFLAPAKRIATAPIKNVTFIRMSIDPYADSNDNLVTILLEFETLIMLDIPREV